MKATTPSGTRILVVEDEALIRTLISVELEDAGFEVIEATNADDALSMLERQDTDLVITDVRMPGPRTGLDVAAWLRAHRPQTKVIVMSGYVHEDVSSAAAQFDAFMRKPFKPCELVDQARALLPCSG